MYLRFREDKRCHKVSIHHVDSIIIHIYIQLIYLLDFKSHRHSVSHKATLWEQTINVDNVLLLGRAYTRFFEWQTLTQIN